MKAFFLAVANHDVTRRAVKTFFQAFAAALAVTAAQAGGRASEVDWLLAADISVLAAVASVATSLAGGAVQKRRAGSQRENGWE